MGDVYLAIAEGIEGFSKLLVVKELRREEDDALHVAMFMDEARLAARLNHPNIVQTLEVGTDGPRRFMVMEYLEGHSLRNVVLRSRRHGREFPAEIYVGILSYVLDALAYVHELTELDGRPLGIVHRDVSPQNVFVTYDGHVKLIDFGIAKTHVASQETTVGIVKGKVRFMAPEQATGRPIDLRTDIFSVGVMLWDALVGRGPWDHQSDVQVMHSLMTGSVPRLADQAEAAKLAPELVALVDRATHPDPDRRFPSASALRDELLRETDATHVRDLPRVLGGIVSRSFAEERLELRALVDTQLRGAAVDTGLSLVSLTRVRTPYADARSQPSISGTPSSAEDAADAAPDLEVIAHPESGPPPRSRVRGMAAALVGTVILGGAAAAGVLSRAHHGPVAAASSPATPATPATPAAANAAAPSASALPGRVHIVVRASPPSAHLSIDGVAVANPYETDLARDDSTHALVAEGPGLVRRTRAFRATVDAEIEIALDRATGPRASPWRERQAISPAPLVAEPERSATRVDPSPPPSETAPARALRSRDMDKENPYAR
jgi:serine/threonine-protein kinase